MTNQSAAQEPTMEEILASIRRIISEDSGSKEEAEAAPPPVVEPEPEPEAEPEFEAELERYEESAPDLEPEPEYAPEPEHEPVATAPVEAEVEEDDIIFSEDDVLELTEPLEMEPEPEPELEPEPEPEIIDEQPEVEAYEAHQEFEPEEDIAFKEPAMTAPASHQTDDSAPLLSSDAANAASAAFGALASSMLTSSGGRTLEDIVSDMLRPMLKQWLDQNLPGLVEQLVREEIERVARRAR